MATQHIDAALGELESVDNSRRLEEMLRKKAAKTTARDLYDLKGKLVRFGMSRGFELEDVLAATDQVLREREQ